MSCRCVNTLGIAKRVDLLFSLGQEIHGWFMQYKQSGDAIECYSWSDRNRRGGKAVYAKHGKDRNEVGWIWWIAAEEGSLEQCIRGEVK